ncbi:SGNH/GDSL hydrolase family protein [Galbibacter sp. PAP.153]|uniref:SGNH/GDSL hydrolase family protein n=1 Tax=Galbibacter sp. PAP.153 TaxID=3104623 RepID=UPI00300A0A72
MKKIILFLAVIIFVGCTTQKKVVQTTTTATPTFKYLALGDSYTIGESVCESCSFPIQLLEKIANEQKEKVALQIIAKTGWTTSDLIKGIKDSLPQGNQDLVTLLIGVNNQYQGKDFSLYQEDFPALLTKAVQLAGGDTNRVIIISIPDYAYTPYGQKKPDPKKISTEIDQYNAFAKKIAEANGVSFVNITNISREGLNNPALIASDGLHPSKECYSSFVSQILFEVKKKNILSK